MHHTAWIIKATRGKNRNVIGVNRGAVHFHWLIHYLRWLAAVCWIAQSPDCVAVLVLEGSLKARTGRSLDSTGPTVAVGNTWDCWKTVPHTHSHVIPGHIFKRKKRMSGFLCVSFTAPVEPNWPNTDIYVNINTSIYLINTAEERFGRLVPLWRASCLHRLKKSLWRQCHHPIQQTQQEGNYQLQHTSTIFKN